MFHLVGWLGVLLSFGEVFVWIFSLATEQSSFPSVPQKWMFCAISTGALSWLMVLLTKGKKTSRLFLREAMAVAGLGWIYFSLCAALPLMGMAGLGFFEAFFESVSAITTTGATVLTDLEALPQSVHLWRCMLQWIGGMGVVFLFVAVLGSGGRKLIHQETSRLSSDNLQPQIQKVAMAYLGIYAGISLVCFLGYLALGMEIFHAVCFAMTTCSTGGMSPVSDFLKVFSSNPLLLWCVVFMFLSGVAFPLHYQLWILHRWDVIKRDLELRVYLILVLLAVVLISSYLLFEHRYDKNEQAIVYSAFQVISIMTTTGYGSVDFALWPDFSQLILVVMMMLGGCAGSTAGGLKISRLIIFAKAISNWLKRNFSPRAVHTVSYGKASIPEHVVTSVIAYVGLYFSVCVVGIVVFAVLQSELDLVTIVSAVVSVFNNVGPALGELGPFSNYSDLNSSALLWLSILMLMGRLEIVVILAIFVPSFWKKF